MVTEAAVERSFSAQVPTAKGKVGSLSLSFQSRVFSKLRDSLREDSCEAQTWLLLNYQKVVSPEKVQKAIAHRQEHVAKKRAAAEARYNASMQKRIRPSPETTDP